MKNNNMTATILFSLFFNLIYGIYNGVIGFSARSEWFITLGAYYIILSITRLGILVSNQNPKKNNIQTNKFVMRFTGFLLIVLSIILARTAYLSLDSERGIKYNEILMITIAVYAFIKITLAIINLVKVESNDSSIVKTLRYITFADALVSIFSLQRSMLVSFGSMEEKGIKIMNSFTGTATYIGVLILGIILIGGKHKWRNQK